ncbi:hypothetical protein Ciccas_002579 [Cichlidogyrus casuarinus]|uniref:Ion transport domain-containing protein n=1 Tax=Cichlidogyrus casuarinus TaxID=1844966 RepID=A0ABD2QGU4_9PLAT
MNIDTDTLTKDAKSVIKVENNFEKRCDTVRTCFLASVKAGLTSGGGLGDALRRPSISEGTYYYRMIYDLSFFVIITLITPNVVFGVIVDTFGALRQSKDKRDENLRNNCFICGLPRTCFDYCSGKFDHHIKLEHNPWHYFDFFVLLRTKDPTEFTGPESHVYKLVQENSYDWFPRMNAMSIMRQNEEKQCEEQNDIKILIEGLQPLKTVNATVASIKNYLDRKEQERQQKQRYSFLATN